MLKLRASDGLLNLYSSPRLPSKSLPDDRNTSIISFCLSSLIDHRIPLHAHICTNNLSFIQILIQQKIVLQFAPRLMMFDVIS
jgi:hypothetical protein